MSYMNDLKYDLEHTRQWAIAAEKDLFEMTQRALRAEARAAAELQVKIEELNKVIKELNDDVAYWHKSHTDVAAELVEAKETIEEGNRIIEDLTQERNGLYESLGITE